MNIKNKLVGILIALTLVLSGYSAFKPAKIEHVEVPTPGAVSSPDVYTYLNVSGGFTQGGDALATSTTGTADTLRADQMQQYSVIRYMANTGNTTLTLPATSTMSNIMQRPGQSRTWWIHNATGTAATTLTLAAGTGIDLIAVTAADDVIDGDEYSKLTCWRQIDSDITCETSELINAD